MVSLKSLKKGVIRPRLIQTSLGYMLMDIVQTAPLVSRKMMSFGTKQDYMTSQTDVCIALCRVSKYHIVYNFVEF